MNTSIRVSREVVEMLREISTISGLKIKRIVDNAICEYAVNHASDYHSQKIQNPNIYPTDTSTVSVTVEQRNYIKKTSSYSSRNGLLGAADRIFIEYQNNHPEYDVREGIRINWLDEEFLNWQTLVP